MVISEDDDYHHSDSSEAEEGEIVTDWRMPRKKKPPLVVLSYKPMPNMVVFTIHEGGLLVDLQHVRPLRCWHDGGLIGPGGPVIVCPERLVVESGRLQVIGSGSFCSVQCVLGYARERRLKNVHGLFQQIYGVLAMTTMVPAPPAGGVLEQFCTHEHGLTLAVFRDIFCTPPVPADQADRPCRGELLNPLMLGFEQTLMLYVPRECAMGKTNRQVTEAGQRYIQEMRSSRDVDMRGMDERTLRVMSAFEEARKKKRM